MLSSAGEQVDTASPRQCKGCSARHPLSGPGRGAPRCRLECSWAAVVMNGSPARQRRNDGRRRHHH
eukprot:8502127-Pyramimonas_sp.AAC.2